MTLKPLKAPESTSPKEFDCDIAIVGGGIVGATLACSLKNSGLRAIAIEAQTLDIAAARKQAYALSLMSGKIFEGIGVWSNILPQIAQFCHIRLSDADYPQVVQFQRTDLDSSALGYVGEHGVVLKALQADLARSPDFQWLCPAQVVGVEYGESDVQIRVAVEGQERRLQAKLLVGADGARSRIRSWANIGTRGWKYWQSCVAFTIKHQAPAMILPSSASGTPARWGFSPYREIAVKSCGLHLTPKPQSCKNSTNPLLSQNSKNVWGEC